MRNLIALGLLFILAGCNSGSSNKQQNATTLNVEEMDLSGTWELSSETHTIRDDTGDIISTSYGNTIYILEDTVYGVQYNDCEDYGNFYSSIGVKTTDYFYLQNSDNTIPGFSAITTEKLQRTYSYQEEWYEDVSFETTHTLTRVNLEPAVDNGYFILNGPVTLAEYDHVCLYQGYKLLGNKYTINLTVPYDDDTVNLGLYFTGEITTGTYTYEDYQSAQEVEIAISSFATAFDETTGSNWLWPENVTVEITEVSNSKIVGSFSFAEEDDGNHYDGEFEIDLNGVATLNNEIIDSVQ